MGQSAKLENTEPQPAVAGNQPVRNVPKMIAAPHGASGGSQSSVRDPMPMKAEVKACKRELVALEALAESVAQKSSETVARPSSQSLPSDGKVQARTSCLRPTAAKSAPPTQPALTPTAAPQVAHRSEAEPTSSSSAAGTSLLTTNEAALPSPLPVRSSRLLVPASSLRSLVPRLSDSDAPRSLHP